MMETWKQFKDTPYEVSTCGRVRNMKTGKMLAIQDNGNGYKQVILWCYGKKGVGIHRLVAMTFLPNPENKPIVDHIDTDPSNNNVENLRWATYTENNLNPITNEKMRSAWTDERREKISENMKKTNASGKIVHFTGEDNAFSKRFKGTHYYNNGVKEDRFKEGKQPDGWVRGRL